MKSKKLSIDEVSSIFFSILCITANYVF